MDLASCLLSHGLHPHVIYLMYNGKSNFEVKGCWNGTCLGRTGKRCAKRMLILRKGRATADCTGRTE